MHRRLIAKTVACRERVLQVQADLIIVAEVGEGGFVEDFALVADDAAGEDDAAEGVARGEGGDLAGYGFAVIGNEDFIEAIEEAKGAAVFQQVRFEAGAGDVPLMIAGVGVPEFDEVIAAVLAAEGDVGFEFDGDGEPAGEGVLEEGAEAGLDEGEGEEADEGGLAGTRVAQQNGAGGGEVVRGDSMAMSSWPMRRMARLALVAAVL